MSRTDTAVVIPALNEEASLPGVLRALPSTARAIVVDNGSTDATAQVARAAGATVLHEPRRGYGSAVQAGIRWLHQDPPAVLAILDADHADRPELLPHLVTPIVEDHADFVLADRTLTAAPGALTRTQRAGNALATTLIWSVTGHRYRDMGPFRALRWSAAATLDLRDPTWGWNVEMQIKAVRAGLRILEIPLPYGVRRAGQSKISGDLRGAARAGSRILWAVGHYARQPATRPDPGRSG